MNIRDAQALLTEINKNWNRLTSTERQIVDRIKEKVNNQNVVLIPFKDGELLQEIYRSVAGGRFFERKEIIK